MSQAKLIILRGPSGAGKSTVAKRLKQVIPGQVIDLDHDFYRIDLLDRIEFDRRGQISQEMMMSDALIALNHDIHVIMHSIFSSQRAVDGFNWLFNKHPNNNYIFNLEATFNETLKRHASRPKAAGFGEKELKEWYKPVEPLGYQFETIVPQASSLEQTVAQIRETAGL